MARNEELAFQIDNLDHDTYVMRLMPNIRPVKKLEYKFKDLPGIAEKLRKCCRVFHDGHPEYVCRQTAFCHFCMRGRSTGISNVYSKALYARLLKQRQINCFHLVIKDFSYNEHELYLSYQALAKWRRRLRYSIASEFRVCTSREELRRYDLNHLDCFTHVSMGTISGAEVYVPHIHLLGQMRGCKATYSSIETCAQEAAENLGLKYLKAKSYRIRDIQNEMAPHKVNDLARCAAYCAVPFKMKNLSAVAQLNACLALPENYRRITRREGEDPFLDKYSITSCDGSHNLRFVVGPASLTSSPSATVELF